ncbi:ABC transporter ATP-binding protein [Rummeliibacillus sp. TYF005]|uniref:ABC transporter ATP-binding protein n=1 Tax=Rummeliibacillus sp. TYF005 TaxID=2058214 RepID=UPI000F521BB1|nr:ABC transporter ATP-binding protein [Rummeliibacillus sp. TYF005]RPJ95272.1 ABC transporter ATP-binding protein [Rummeliibacillus sp. TYF005]
MTILTLDHVTKSFGSNLVIDDISFQLEEGKIFGLLGQNGAGKTTLMKMILGLLPITKGKILLFDEEVKYGYSPTNRHIGYLPDVPSYYSYMTAYEYLILCGEITGIPKKTLKERAEKYLKLVGLEKNKKKIQQFSRGMKQRLGIAQALIHQPKLLICDEPTSALDPIGRKEILDILKSIKKETTVILSTHILHDAEQICDEVAMLHNGKFVVTGTLSEIMKTHSKQQIRVVFDDEKQAQNFVEKSEMIENVRIQSNILLIEATNIKDMQKQIFTQCTTLHLFPSSIEIVHPSLDEIFLEVSR